MSFKINYPYLRPWWILFVTGRQGGGSKKRDFLRWYCNSSFPNFNFGTFFRGCEGLYLSYATIKTSKTTNFIRKFRVLFRTLYLLCQTICHLKSYPKDHFYYRCLKNHPKDVGGHWTNFNQREVGKIYSWRSKCFWRL